MESRSCIWRISCYPRTIKFFSAQVNTLSAYKTAKVYAENYIAERFSKRKPLGYFYVRTEVKHMPYIPPEVVEKAREMDLLTYLKNYEPQELVHFGGNTYCTREHDSLKISNGKWCWFSRGIGGYSALDYLIKVKEMPFMQAVETIMGNLSATPPTVATVMTKPKEKVWYPRCRAERHAEPV